MTLPVLTRSRLPTLRPAGCVEPASRRRGQRASSSRLWGVRCSLCCSSHRTSRS